jgi:hypothetical protein
LQHARNIYGNEHPGALRQTDQMGVITRILHLVEVGRGISAPADFSYRDMEEKWMLHCRS